jgi:hypothetical protein
MLTKANLHAKITNVDSALAIGKFVSTRPCAARASQDTLALSELLALAISSLVEVLGALDGSLDDYFVASSRLSPAPGAQHFFE